MIRRIKNSLVFRLPLVYKKIIEPFGLSIRKDKTQNQDFNLTILVGKAQLSMLCETLNSIIKNFEDIPSIFIFTDNNLSPEECYKVLNWQQQTSLKVISANECISFHKENHDLVSFAKKNPMGLKLAAILQIAAQGKPVLYCDTDVLWFGDPQLIIKQMLANDQLLLSLSYDFQPAYDQSLVEKGNLSILNNPPYFCAGILLYKLTSKTIEENLARILPLAEKESNHFTEQTIFAYLNKICGGFGLDEQEFQISLKDQYHFLPNKNNPIARHYIGPVRHLFWRDAFFMRIGLLKK
jgi:lipopolysaccharide biosynthesis glycosyltransferase